MKRLLLQLLFLFFSGYWISAQTPQSIPYQAVARDASGNLLVNANICVQFRIYNQAAGGTLLYEEHQTVTTNKLGLFNLNMGAGTYDGGTSSNLSGINWASTSEYVEIGLDLTGTCGSYTTLGRSQMLSVPYALYAGNAASAPASATSPLSGNGTPGSPLAVGYDNSSIKVNGSNQLYAPNTGTVTNIATNNGLTGGPIIGTGTIGIATGGVTNSMLANSTISGIALGGNLDALTIGTGLSGNSYNGSSPVTIAIASGGVTNSMLANSSITISNGTGITGGGAVALGGSLTLNTPWTISGNNIYNNNAANVGIGTTSPSTLLSVGSGSSSNFTVDASGDVTGVGNTTLSSGSGSTTAIGTGSSSGAITVGGSANNVTVGGSTTGTVALGSTGSTTNIISGSGGANINAGNSQPTNINTGTNTATATIGNSTSKASFINASPSGSSTYLSNLSGITGTVGVGTTSPGSSSNTASTALVDVNGSILANDIWMKVGEVNLTSGAKRVTFNNLNSNNDKMYKIVIEGQMTISSGTDLYLVMFFNNDTGGHYNYYNTSMGYQNGNIPGGGSNTGNIQAVYNWGGTDWIQIARTDYGGGGSCSWNTCDFMSDITIAAFNNNYADSHSNTAKQVCTANSTVRGYNTQNSCSGQDALVNWSTGGEYDPSTAGPITSISFQVSTGGNAVTTNAYFTGCKAVLFALR